MDEILGFFLVIGLAMIAAIAAVTLFSLIPMLALYEIKENIYNNLAASQM
jgi:hypothetical protein